MNPDDYFVKLNKSLSDNAIQQLIEIQNTIGFRKFIWNDIWDGNYLNNDVDVRQLPEEVVTTFSDAFDICGNFCFLKNTGNVIIHTDVTRQASITIPLNVTNSCTTFHDDSKQQTLDLCHNGKIFLQNNQATHSVKDNGDEFRMFLQINFFDHPYEYYREKFKQYGYF